MTDVSEERMRITIVILVMVVIKSAQPRCNFGDKTVHTQQSQAFLPQLDIDDQRNPLVVMDVNLRTVLRRQTPRLTF